MKKTLLLTALLASASAFAATTGHVGISSETSTDLFTKKDLGKQIKLTTEVTPKVEAELAVTGTGFSFGGEYYLDGLRPFNGNLSLKSIENVSKGNIHAKYELPEIHGVKSYVKATFNHEKKLTGEFDAKYEHNGYTFGLNSKTTVPLFRSYTDISNKAVFAAIMEAKNKEEKDLAEYVEKEKAKIDAITDLANITEKDKKAALDYLNKGKKATDIKGIDEITLENCKAYKNVVLAEERANKAEKISEKYSRYVTVNTLRSDIISKHTLSVEKDKIGKFSDLKASLAFVHAWGDTYDVFKVEKEDTKVTKTRLVSLDGLTGAEELEKISNKDAFKSVELKGEGQYKGFDKLNLKGQVAIKYNHNGSNLAGQFLGYDTINETLYKHTGFEMDYLPMVRNITGNYKLTGEYTGFNNLKLTGSVFVNHINELKYRDLDKFGILKFISKNKALGEYQDVLEDKLIASETPTQKGDASSTNDLSISTMVGMKLAFAEYGIDANLEYKPMANLTLTGNAVVAGQTLVMNVKAGTEAAPLYAKETVSAAYVKLAAGAKYDYKVNEKLTVSPELNGSFEAFGIRNWGNKLHSINTLSVTPKVAVDYKISDSLSLNGAVESKFVFNNLNPEFKLKHSYTTVKSSMGLKYTW